jgi:hypothetical protein
METSLQTIVESLGKVFRIQLLLWREIGRFMKTKTRHHKGHKWRKKCDGSPIAKGRRAKIHGVRNPRKAKRAGGRSL